MRPESSLRPTQVSCQALLHFALSRSWTTVWNSELLGPSEDSKSDTEMSGAGGLDAGFVLRLTRVNQDRLILDSSHFVKSTFGVGASKKSNAVIPDDEVATMVPGRS